MMYLNFRLMKGGHTKPTIDTVVELTKTDADPSVDVPYEVPLLGVTAHDRSDFQLIASLAGAIIINTICALWLTLNGLDVQVRT